MLLGSVPGSEKRKARTARLSIRYSEIRLKAPSHRKAEKLPSIKVYAVLVREESPPEGEEPIESVTVDDGSRQQRRRCQRAGTMVLLPLDHRDLP